MGVKSSNSFVFCTFQKLPSVGLSLTYPSGLYFKNNWKMQGM